MAQFFSDTVRNARANAIESTIGASAKLELWSGTVPAHEGATPAGTKLATINLPSDWMGAASAGVIHLAGTWSGTVSTAGTVTFGRITSNAGVAHWQFSITMPGGGGDAIMDNTNVAVNQVISAPSFQFTEAH